MQVVNILLFLVIFLLGIFSLARESINEVQPSSFMPADTLVYLEQKNGVEAIENFRRSRLGYIFQSIDFPEIMKEADIDPAYRTMVAKTFETLGRLQDDRLVRELLGRRCTLALIPRRNRSKNGDNSFYVLEDQILLVSRPMSNVETLEQLLADYVGTIPASTMPYGRYMIKRFQFENNSVSIAFADGLVLASLEERVLREALDLHDKKSGTLKANEEFQSLTRELEGAERLVYLSVGGLQDLAEDEADHAGTPKEQAILAEFASFKGVATVAYGGWHNRKLQKDKIIVHLNQNTMDERVKAMVATTPSINETLPFVAGDAMFYYWSNTLDLRLLWEMYVSEAGSGNSDVREIRKNIRHISGYDLEELISMISSHVSFLVRETARDQFVPIPDFALLIKLNDSAHLSRAIRQSLKNLDIKMQSGNYKNIQYFYWGIYPQESLQPVYAIHRDFLVIANTLDILKTIIDTPLNNSRLVAAQSFRELDPGFQTLNNSVCYIDQARLLARLQEFIGWAGTMQAIQDRQAAEKSKILIDKLIDPLFWGLGMYKQSATRTYVENDRIYIETKTRKTN